MNREQKERLQYILLRFLNNEASDGERMELSELLKAEPDNVLWTELLEELYNAEAAPVSFDENRWQPVLEELLRKNRQSEQTSTNKRKHTFPLRRIAVAAAIIIGVGMGSYLLFFNKPARQTGLVQQPSTHDVKAPATNRAVITLADGRTVALDSFNNGMLAQQGNVTITKTADGRIVYRGQASHTVQNTLTNPRGSKVIDITLSDGTRVWLNAGSSVTYPAAFAGNERKVIIKGEAYFEVAHDPAKPFFVIHKPIRDRQVEIKVLGTHFNVNAYDDEADIKVTLLEGSVNVSNGQDALTIDPNQQAIVTPQAVSLNAEVDVKTAVAWKNGRFMFGAKADIQTIMRQLARWYDVEVKYSGEVPNQHFGGEMPNSISLLQVLDILKTSGLKFSIEGRTVIITH